jgi:hypothetical protein
MPTSRDIVRYRHTMRLRADVTEPRVSGDIGRHWRDIGPEVAGFSSTHFLRNSGFDNRGAKSADIGMTWLLFETAVQLARYIDRHRRIRRQVSARHRRQCLPMSRNLADHSVKKSPGNAIDYA